MPPFPNDGLVLCCYYREQHASLGDLSPWLARPCACQVRSYLGGPAQRLTEARSLQLHGQVSCVVAIVAVSLPRPAALVISPFYLWHVLGQLHSANPDWFAPVSCDNGLCLNLHRTLSIGKRRAMVVSQVFCQSACCTVLDFTAGTVQSFLRQTRRKYGLEIHIRPAA